MTDSREIPIDTPLSPEGQRRRGEILRLACGEARLRRQRRAARRAAACGTVVLAIAVGMWMRPWHPEAPQIAKVPLIPHVTLPSPSRAEIVIGRIQTDPTLASRWAVPLQEPTWQRLSDDDLLARLQEAGRPAGLAYVDGRAQILFREPAHR
jgi:hypothetical protein